MPPLQSLQLRRLFLRNLSSSSSRISSSSFIQKPHLVTSSAPTPLTSSHFRHCQPTSSSASRSHFLSLPQTPLSRTFSSSSSETPVEDHDQIARSLSSELVKDPESEPLPIGLRLNLNFSHVVPTAPVVLAALNLSPEAGRTVLWFNDWLISNPKFEHSDEILSFFVDYLGRRKDFKAVHDVIVGSRAAAGPKTLASAVDRLVRAGRATQAVAFFERMERVYGLKRDKESLRLVVEKLCENGYANYAEKMVKSLANEFFPDERICDSLIKGWCVDGKLEEARRLAGEMYRGGFELGPMAYNAILDCVCKLCREKDPFRLHSEAEKVLLDMDMYGVPRNVETFNVLINNLCKIRKTEDAMKVFDRMGEWGSYPNAETFLILTKSLYQAARVGDGDEMIDRMKSAGYGESLDKKEYYSFLKILCGIERIDHALSVFDKMKKDGCEPGIKTYDLLMGKLCAHNRIDKANALFNEALRKGIPVEPKAYQVDPRYLKKPKAVKKKEKKRETLPEKMARKRRRLKQIRLSFVKKSKRMMRRAF
ncbi:Pentatricopeptide repeat [Parasponia andersonii]|uniref:Pentatricopeptide repeat n=1 Tax=Parasponia andersonii TaxID=3476 RepID=A0A2P5BN30_PARAD|nr:Pentatricopeptide repeat [Parasponia andersonii]